MRHTRVEGDVPPGRRIFDSIDFVRPDREPNPANGASAPLRELVLGDNYNDAVSVCWCFALQVHYQERPVLSNNQDLLLGLSDVRSKRGA